jgi:hypothetical protein
MNSEIDNQPTASELLRTAKVIVAPETFVLVSLTREEFSELIRSSAIGPVGVAPYMIFWDRYEVTLLLAQTDFAAVMSSAPLAKTESGFRLLTFDLMMDLDTVGFLAEVSRILAADGIAVFAVSAFSRDHLLIRQDNLAAAMRALGDHVADLC